MSELRIESQHKSDFIPNFTQIPNVVFDYWMPRLKPAAFKVLLCICRKTYGWHKTSDLISKNQLMNATGLTKNTIQTAIEELEDHGLLLKAQFKNEYGYQPNEYGLNVDKPIDAIYSEKGQNLVGVGQKLTQGVGQKLTQGVGQNLTPQKKAYTKEKEFVCSEAGGKPPPVPNGPSSHCKNSFLFENREITIEDMFSYSLRTNKNWSSNEIKEAWDALLNTKAKIFDPFKFFEGTIRNLRNKLRNKIITAKGAKKCNTQKVKSGKSKESPSENSTQTPTQPDSPMKFVSFFDF